MVFNILPLKVQDHLDIYIYTSLYFLVNEQKSFQDTLIYNDIFTSNLSITLVERNLSNKN